MQTTALRLLSDPGYEALCDYDEMVLSQILETPPGWSDLASFLAELTSRLNALHNPHGHRLLYQSLRQGTETTQDLSRNQDPVIQALFHAFAAPIAHYRDHIGQGTMLYGVATGALRDSTAAGRCVCTARAITPATCILADGYPRLAIFSCPTA